MSARVDQKPVSALESEKDVIRHEHVEQVEYADEKADPEAVREVASIDEGMDPVAVKKLTRKIDFRLIPVLSAMYAISLIDRTNLAIARAANNNHMNTELGTGTGDRYSIITLIFFIPYIIFEMPSQLGLRRFGARLWLGTAVCCWGVIMLCMAFVKTWGALAAMRALLGIFESALFPGAAYLISCWYPRKDMAVRTVVFYITSAVAGSFAKPLGYTFSLLHNKRGMSGWRWMFLIYGVMTIVIGIIGLIFIIDFPHKATFLTEPEREMVQTRIERDRADSKPDALTGAKAWKYAKQVRPWIFAFMFMSTTTASYSLAYFMPTILQTMGFTNVESMLLGTPAYFWALAPSLISGRIADRVPRTRAYVVMFNSMCIILGTCMYSQIDKSQKAARFAGMFLAVGGANSNPPLVISWQQTAVRAHSKRAYCAALTVAFGGLGGIFGSALFMEKEAKQGYPTGIYFTLGVNAATTMVALILSFWMRKQNRRADRGEIVLEGHDDFRYQP